VIGLARSERPVPDGYFDNYYKHLHGVVAGRDGVLDAAKYAEYSRVALALTAIGRDPRSVAGYNLLKPLEYFNRVVYQGINGPAWALIAFDSGMYEIPAASGASAATTRSLLVDYIIAYDLPGGGWGLAADDSSLDAGATFTVAQALAPYYSSTPGAKEALDKALEVMSALYAKGGYDGGAEDLAQGIAALCALGIDPGGDERFIRDGKSMVDALLECMVDVDSGRAAFKREKSGDVSQLATEQSLCALTAYERYLKGKNRLYDMTPEAAAQYPAPAAQTHALIEALPHPGDVGSSDFAAVHAAKESYDALSDEHKALILDRLSQKLADALSAVEALAQAPAVRFTSLENASGSPGTPFNAWLSVTKWALEGSKSAEATIIVPAGFEVDRVSSDALTGGSLRYNLDFNTLRIAYISTTESDIAPAPGSQFPQDVFTISFKAVEDIGEEDCSFTLEKFALRANSSDPPVEYDLKAGSPSFTVRVKASDRAVSHRILYTGDGSDSYGFSQSAVAIEFVNVPGSPRIGMGSVELLYSPDLTKKSGALTYVAVVPRADAAALDVLRSYSIGAQQTAAERVVFGDVDASGDINAQDAVDALDYCLLSRRGIDERSVLACNVNADGKVDAGDALAIAERFASQGQMEFAVLGR
jgi:hypothetical protein